MSPAASVRAVLACAAAAPVAFAFAAPVHACLFSNVASAYANGAAAYRVKVLPARQGEAVWAPFAFRRQFAPGQALHLHEDMREVARGMGRAALHWRVRWLFGDGTHAMGVAVTHAYRHHGLYKIQVESYYSGGRSAVGWYAFDMIDVAVGPPPAGATWMRVSPPAA